MRVVLTKPIAAMKDKVKDWKHVLSELAEEERVVSVSSSMPKRTAKVEMIGKIYKAETLPNTFVVRSETGASRYFSLKDVSNVSESSEAITILLK